MTNATDKRRGGSKKIDKSRKAPTLLYVKEEHLGVATSAVFAGNAQSYQLCDVLFVDGFIFL